MSSRAQIVVELDADLKNAFMEAAGSEDRSTSEIVQDMIRRYVEDHAVTPEYLDFLERKVARARQSIAEGRIIPSAEVEAHFAAMRARMLGRDG